MNEDLIRKWVETLPAEAEASTVSSGDSIAELISNRFSDPLMGALATALLQTNTASHGSRDRGSGYRHRLDGARRLIKKLRAELATKSSIIGYIAEAFGACQECWGQDEHCDLCRGYGVPGSVHPNRGDLLALIEPALDRLDLRVVGKTGGVNRRQPTALGSSPRKED